MSLALANEAQTPRDVATIRLQTSHQTPTTASIRKSNFTMARSAMTQLSVTRPDDAEAVDDAIVFKPDVALQLNSFRQKLSATKNNAAQLRLCAQKRDELLGRYNEADILSTAYERIMSDGCSAYRQLKQRTNRKSPAEQEDDQKQWGRFSGAATSGSKLLPPLKEVVRCWGPEVVWHYQWSSKGQKYLDKLCAGARAVCQWEKAVVGLNWSILSRSKSLQRYPVELINPIEPADLDRLRAWSSQDPAPYRKLTAEDLSDAFGFDKYGLMVHKAFAADLPRSEGAGTTLVPAVPEGNGADTAGPPGQTLSQPDHVGSNADGITAEVNDTSLIETVDATTATNHNPSTPNSEEDTAPTTPEASSHFSNNMSLRTRKELNYREPPGPGTFKDKQARSSVESSKILLRCSAEVPPILLLALEDPSTFGPETVEQFQHFLPNL